MVDRGSGQAHVTKGLIVQALYSQSDMLEIWFCCLLGQLSSPFLSFIIWKMEMIKVFISGLP